MSLVEIQQVTKRFGRVTALDGLDLRIDTSEVRGFIGPNGAGKTTALRILMGILKPTKGTAYVFGKDAWKEAVAIHKNTAYVPGEVNLWPNLTGGEVIDLLLRMRGKKEAPRRKELLERFDLDPRKKCRTYSKGNRQKVALVAAFASDADLYVLDEPTSGLDPLMERVFQECVQEATDRGAAVLLSSHILSEVEKLCDTVSIIRRGKIIESGTLTELRHLTRTVVHVRTRQPVDEMRALPFVHDWQATENGLRFAVDGDALDRVIAQLSAAGIDSLECMPPTLEQLFMSHYEEGRGER